MSPWSISYGCICRGWGEWLQNIPHQLTVLEYSCRSTHTIAYIASTADVKCICPEILSFQWLKDSNSRRLQWPNQSEQTWQQKSDWKRALMSYECLALSSSTETLSLLRQRLLGRWTTPPVQVSKIYFVLHKKQLWRRVWNTWWFLHNSISTSRLSTIVESRGVATTHRLPKSALPCDVTKDWQVTYRLLECSFQSAPGTGVGNNIHGAHSSPTSLLSRGV